MADDGGTCFTPDGAPYPCGSPPGSPPPGLEPEPPQSDRPPCPPGYSYGTGAWSDVCVEGGVGPGGLNPKSGHGGGTVGTPPPVQIIPGSPRIDIPPYTPAAPDEKSREMFDLLMQGIRDAYAGKFVPYNDDTLNAIKGKLFQSSTGRAAAGKQALGQDLVRRGLSRSGIAAEQMAATDRAAASDYSGNYRDVLIKAAEENYRAKTNALVEARAVVTLRLQYDLANARNELDRNIASSNAALAHLRIQQEAANLQAQLRTAYELARLNNQAALEQLIISSGLKPPTLPV